MVRIIFCLALVMALAAPAAAQSSRIHGSVTDQSGAVLPAVEVKATMTNGSDETIRRVATDGKGSYGLDNLAPGSWALTMSLPGFETATRRVTVQTGEALEWSAMLQLGSIQETVSITTSATEPAVRRETPVPFTAAVTPPPAPAPGAIRVGGSIKPPRKIVHVSPVYPAEAVAQGVSGVVILRAVIGADGFVRDITPLRSPNESLTLSATSAFNGWQFTPTLLNGVPMDTRITATFNFQQQF
jgi:TonB family protein